MYVLKQGIKSDHHRRWSLPDRTFFGYGACHILAGVFLETSASRLLCGASYPGRRLFRISRLRNQLTAIRSVTSCLEHHKRVWSSQYADCSRQSRESTFSRRLT